MTDLVRPLLGIVPGQSGVWRSGPASQENTRVGDVDLPRRGSACLGEAVREETGVGYTRKAPQRRVWPRGRGVSAQQSLWAPFSSAECRPGEAGLSLKFPFIVSPLLTGTSSRKPSLISPVLASPQGSHNALCFLSALSTSAYRHSSPSL